MPRLIPETTKLRVVDMYKAGYKLQEICDETGVCTFSINKILHLYNVINTYGRRNTANRLMPLPPPEARMNVMTDEERDRRILELFNKGLDVKEICDALHVNLGLVMSILNGATTPESTKPEDFFGNPVPVERVPFTKSPIDAKMLNIIDTLINNEKYIEASKMLEVLAMLKTKEN